MGTRKRAGKGRHDKKGKGKKHHKKQPAHYDDWDPVSSGQDSDTPSEPERSDSPRLSKQGRQHSRRESDNDKRVDTSKVTGGQRWMPLFVIVLLFVVVLSAAPFLLHHYGQADTGFMSFLKPFAREQQSSDFSQSEMNVEDSFTEKDESTDCNNDASCLKDNKITGQEFHAADKVNRNDAELQTPTDGDEEYLDKGTDAEDFSRNKIEKDKRSVSVGESVALDEEAPLPSDVSRTDTQQANDEAEMDRDGTEQVSHVVEADTSKENEATKSEDGEITLEGEIPLSKKTVVTESTAESLQSSDASEHEPLLVEESNKEESWEAVEQPAESAGEESQEVVEQPAESAREEAVGQPAELSREESDGQPAESAREEAVGQPAESTREESQEVVEQPAESARVGSEEASSKPDSPTNVESPGVESVQVAEPTKESSSEPSDTQKKSDRDTGAGEQTGSVTHEPKSPAVHTDNIHGGDGRFRDNVDTVTIEDGKQATNKPKKIYAKANITNSDDNKIRQQLDEADELLEKNHIHQAQVKYRAVLGRHPHSPRANYGLAQTLCKQAEEQLSNKLLEECIAQYQKVLNLPDVPKVLMLKAGRTCAERQQFRGWGHKAVKVYKILIDDYPDELQLWNELGVQYLMIGRNSEAKAAFTQMLYHAPKDPFANAHMGFIYKTSDNNLEKAVPMLLDALSSDDPSVLDGRFYFHLGDALQRLGNKTEAYKWYEKGEELGLFRSKFQRSLYNVEHLTARPWWTKEQTGQQQLIQMLEDNWKIIRDEGLTNMDKTGLFIPENENLRETGDWKQFTLFQQGRKNVENCKKAPKTCALIEQFPAAAACKRGQVKYSIMQPGVHVWPHCGPTNCRIRMHLGLVVPKGCCRIRVVDDTRTWEEGKVIVFDDSFEHEVWHDGNKFRLVLIVDIWHPELTSRHKASLSPI